MSRIGGYLPEPIARQFFSDSQAFVTSATGAVGAAQKVEGGCRITGRWPFGSGAHHASHFMGLASSKGVDGKDEPPLCCYFERRDVTVHDTWLVSGLRATGSCDFEVRDLFVPESRTHVFMASRPTQDGIVYHLPPLSAFAWTVAVVPLGIARGARTPSSSLRAGRPGWVSARCCATVRSCKPIMAGRTRCIVRRALS
jgi:indole-3-acetate monooxygenase